MALLECTKPVDACGREVLHPDCSEETVDVGLGPGRKEVIQTKWVGTPSDDNIPDVWLFVEGYRPLRLDEFTDGSTYTLNWDFRKTLQNGKVRFGLHFTPNTAQQAQGYKAYWIFSNDPQATVAFTETCTTITFTDAWGDSGFNPFEELALVGDEGTACDTQCWGTRRQFGIAIYDCCPLDCTKPYDNTLFCSTTHDDTAIAGRALLDPGLAKQAFISQQGVTVAVRGVALTRSADAFDQDVKLLYGSQRWVMVWDLELNRLVDFFPQEWLRHGAAAYYQWATLRKDVKSGRSSRKPYYIEVVDLGLVNSPQGSYDLDRDQYGQHATNWDVPSRLMAIGVSRQQAPVEGFGTIRPFDQQLAAEFNHLSVDAYNRVVREAVPAQRERWVADRAMFLDQTARQRFHDQVTFLHREVAEKTLRLMTDNVEQLKHLVDQFNPEAVDGFGYYMVVILNMISNKLVRTSKDLTGGIFKDSKIPASEETMGDWARYAYGELRRLVELEKIDKKDVQAVLLEALGEVDPTDPTGGFEALKQALNIPAIRARYELAAEGEIPAGAGLLDPDTLDQNRERGLAK